MLYGLKKTLIYMGFFFLLVSLRAFLISVRIISILESIFCFKIPLWFRIIEILDEYLEEYCDKIESFLENEIK